MQCQWQRKEKRSKVSVFRQREAEREKEVMASSTSPLLPTLHFIHPLFSIPSGQSLTITLFFSILHPPTSLSPALCLYFLHLSVTLSLPLHSPEMTSGMRDQAVKCQHFIHVGFFFRILIIDIHTQIFEGQKFQIVKFFKNHFLLSIISTSSSLDTQDLTFFFFFYRSTSAEGGAPTK